MLATTSPLSGLNSLNHVVAIGGGHGLGRVMSALNFLGSRLTGIVTTTDNGGSTGRIRTQQGGIAWGDLRNCLNQIITTPSTASMLFEYRFSGEGELSGHNLGNLMLKALENIKVRPLLGVNLIRELLHVDPFLIPMSEKPVHLSAIMPSGATVLGEVNIDNLTELPTHLSLVPNVAATPEAVQAIEQAELILFGPGSFLTSILPPILASEIKTAIANSKAIKIFIDNLGLEYSPSAQLSLANKIAWLHHYIGKNCINGIITPPYTSIDTNLLQQMTIITRQLNADDISYRHDREKLACAIDELIKLKIRKSNKPKTA